jgi:beta-1,2-mannosidase
MKRMSRWTLVSCIALLAAADAPLARFERVSPMPILSPRPQGFDSAGTFNPAVIRRGSEIVMLYRAQDAEGTSRIGYATSKDGIHFVPWPRPVLRPEAPYEANGGVEDPRVVRIKDTFYMTYTGYNRVDAQLCMARSDDLLHWKRMGVIIPANKGRWNVHWTKSGAILDQKIAGHYWMYFMGDAAGENGANQTGVAYSDDLKHWTEPLDHPVLPHRAGAFDSRVVEPGPPPVLTERGILLIYNGADDKLVYRTGWALFDRADPSRVLARSDKPVFEPQKHWERVGQVPNVVFVEGMIRDQTRWLLYYGAADKYVGVAATGLNDSPPRI